ncbi:coiled-coil domain-containing protein 178 [Echinops telfairi]|uniref:Coiled-coil domain-containing protein 178 n=1 Tax=Echinops telfairi TaxID=9371 RepID=A0AC55DJP5_ECHTE|nr:coiled-coil domain-containing protein 178 [Echinops telfairi]
MTNTEEKTKALYFGYPTRRHSCCVVNIPGPCVNKIISHIEDVESKIQKYLRKFETAYGEWTRVAPARGGTEDWSTASIAAIEGPVQTEEKDAKCPEIKQEMGPLLSEAIHLIKSLETDRAEAEEALRVQKLRKKNITTQIDSWSIWRLEELPSAVQKEHEMHLRDIIELQWHIKNKGQQLQVLEEQKKKLEEANTKIEVDIEYMITHDPLLDLKRNQELETLRDLYFKKREAMERYKHVHGELEDTKEHCESAKVKGEQIKTEMDKDIRHNEINLEMYKKEMDKLNKLCLQYFTSIDEANIDIEEKEGEVTEALKKAQSSENELALLTRKLEDLRRLYDRLSLKKKHYEKEYKEVLNTFYAAKNTWDTELSNVSKDFSDLSKSFTQVSDENKKKEKETEILADLINESIKKKAQHELAIQSLFKLKAENNELIKELYKEAYNVGTLFHLTKFNTDELEGKIAEVRRRFKGREDFLKRLIRNEVATALQIQKKMYHIQDIQAQEKQSLLDKKIIYILALEKVEEPLLELEEEFTRIKNIHRHHADVINKILEKKNFIRRNVEKTKKKLEMKEKQTRNALTETEVKRSTIFKEIYDTRSKASVFQAKINNLNEELKVKEEEKKRFEKTFDVLNENFLAIRHKKEHIQAVFDHLKDEKKALEERLSEEGERFNMITSMRQKTLEEIKKTQLDSLEENLRLAQEYQKVQDDFLIEKEKYFNQYERKLSLEASVRDKVQFCQLQRRIQKVWETHFKLVVLYNQTKLAKFQQDSQGSIQKILAVQEDSSHLIQHIGTFFQSLPDGLCEFDG